jgi:hypothetical protein
LFINLSFFIINIFCISACSNFALKYNSSVNNIKPDIPSLIPGNLSNGAQEYQGRTNVTFLLEPPGMDDAAVDVKKARNAIENFNECQPKGMAKLTLFDNTGHSSHQRVLDLTSMFEYSKLRYTFDENIYTWLMLQSLSNN